MRRHPSTPYREHSLLGALTEHRHPGRLNDWLVAPRGPEAASALETRSFITQEPNTCPTGRMEVSSAASPRATPRIRLYFKTLILGLSEGPGQRLQEFSETCVGHV